MGLLKAVKSVFTGGSVGGAMEAGNQILQSIDGLVTSAEEKKELRASVISTMLNAQTSVITAEAQAGGIAAKWRPWTMLMFVGLIVCHYAIFPMIAVMFPVTAPVFAAMALPPELWVIIQVGLGGYAGGRSVEKVVGMLTTSKELRKMTKLEAKIEKQNG